MDDKHLYPLIAWTMVSAMNSAVLVEQNQRQRPLTYDEMDKCHERAAEMAAVLLDGYHDGFEAGLRGDDQPPPPQN